MDWKSRFFRGFELRTKNQNRIDAKGYMLACTDAQLYGVVERETQRLKDHGPLGKIARVSRIMLDEARIELKNRGLS
jgi:hypothetical protein